MNTEFTLPDDVDLFLHLFSLNNTKLMVIFDQQAHTLREMAMQYGEVDPQSIGNLFLILLLIARRASLKTPSSNVG